MLQLRNGRNGAQTRDIDPAQISRISAPHVATCCCVLGMFYLRERQLKLADRNSRPRHSGAVEQLSYTPSTV